MTSYPITVYIEVSKNHNIPLSQVIKKKYTPEIKLLIMYYNHKIRTEAKEAQKLEEQNKKINRETTTHGR